MLSALFSPKREVPRPGEKVVSLKLGYSRPGEKAFGASVISGLRRKKTLLFGLFSPKQ